MTKNEVFTQKFIFCAQIQLNEYYARVAKVSFKKIVRAIATVCSCWIMLGIERSLAYKVEYFSCTSLQSKNKAR